MHFIYSIETESWQWRIANHSERIAWSIRISFREHPEYFHGIFVSRKAKRTKGLS